MTTDLEIISPKRTGKLENQWEGFFPYYAGFPEAFALRILKTSRLDSEAVIWDPWNGSGTTTYAAAKLGLASIGFDINPAMVVVGRARLLASTEADSIEPILLKILKSSRTNRPDISHEDPLLDWYGPETACTIRAIEQSIRSHLVGSSTITTEGTKLENLSCLAAVFYVSLFSVGRTLGAKFRASNPTWIRRPKASERRISASRARIEIAFTDMLTQMAKALQLSPPAQHEIVGASRIKVADSTTIQLPDKSIDMVLTSPPYCTRIDYAAATRIELSILDPLLDSSVTSLRRDMMGSTQVPKGTIQPNEGWGHTCLRFLSALRGHSSKASASYYHKTHLDYFEKLFRSTRSISQSLKTGGSAIIVVQDSYYKDIHNDLAQIVTEMGSSVALTLKRREDFKSHRSMSGINTHSKSYDRPSGAVETVLCFEKSSGEIHL